MIVLLFRLLWLHIDTSEATPFLFYFLLRRYRIRRIPVKNKESIRDPCLEGRKYKYTNVVWWDRSDWVLVYFWVSWSLNLSPSKSYVICLRPFCVLLIWFWTFTTDPLWTLLYPPKRRTPSKNLTSSSMYLVQFIPLFTVSDPYEVLNL